MTFSIPAKFYMTQSDERQMEIFTKYYESRIDLDETLKNLEEAEACHSSGLTREEVSEENYTTILDCISWRDFGLNQQL